MQPRDRDAACGSAGLRANGRTLMASGFTPHVREDLDTVGVFLAIPEWRPLDDPRSTSDVDPTGK